MVAPLNDPIMGKPPGAPIPEPVNPFMSNDPIMGVAPPDLPVPADGIDGPKAVQESVEIRRGDDKERLQPARNAMDEFAASRIPTEYVDAPAVPFTAFDSASRQSAYVKTLRKMSETGILLPPNASNQVAITGLADKLTEKYLRQGEMIDMPNLSPRLVDTLRGAFLHNMINIYAEPSAEEIGFINKQAVDNIGSLLKDKILLRLREIEASTNAGFGRAVDDEEAAVLQQEFAKIQAFTSQSGEIHIQDFFMNAVKDVARRAADTKPAASIEQDEFEILGNLLEVPFSRRTSFNNQQASYATSPAARQIAEIMNKHLVTIDQKTGEAMPMGVPGLLQLGYEGALIKSRAGRLGIPQDILKELSPEGMLFFTHRNLMMELAETRAMDLATRSVDASLSAGPEIDTFVKRMTASGVPTEELRSEVARTLFPNIVDQLLFRAEAPLRIMRQNTAGAQDPTVEQQLDRVLAGIGGWLIDGVSNTGDAVSVAEEFWAGNARIDSFNPREDAIVAGIHWRAGQDMAVNGLVEGEKRAQQVIPLSPLRNGGADWMRAPSELYFYEMGKDGTYRGKITRAGMEVFIENPNFLRLLGIVGFEQQAADTLQRYGEQLGFGKEVLQNQLRMTSESITDDGINSLFFNQFRTEDVEKAGQGSLAAWKAYDENPSITNLRNAMAISLVTGYVFVGNDMREMTKLFVTDPEIAVGLNVFGAGAGAAVRPLLRVTASPLLNRVKKIMIAQRARFVINTALRQDGQAVGNLRKTVGRMLSESGPNGKFHALEAATDALDHIEKIRRDRLAQEAGFILPERHLTNKQMRGEVTVQAKRAQKVVKHMQPEDIGEMLSDMKMDDQVRRWVSNPGAIRSLIPEALRGVGFNVGQRRLRPSFLESARGVFSRIIDNPSLDVADFPIAIELMDRSTLPFWSRILGKKGTEAAGFVHDLGRFLGEFRQDIVAVRAANADRWANVDEFFDYIKVGAANEYRQIEMMRSMARSTDDLAVVKELDDAIGIRLAQVDALQDTFRARKFDQGINGLADVPMFAQASLERYMTFLSLKYGDDHLYQKLRRVNETQADFDGRMGRYSRRWDAAPGERNTIKERIAAAEGRDPNPGLAREAELFKREIIEGFFDSPGLRKEIFLDVFEGAVSSKRAKAVLRPERQAVREAAKKLKRNVLPGDEINVIREGDDVIAAKIADIKRRIQHDMKGATTGHKQKLDQALKDLENIEASDLGDATRVLADMEDNINDLRRIMREAHPDKGGEKVRFQNAFFAFNRAKKELQDLQSQIKDGGDPFGGLREDGIRRAKAAVADAQRRLDDAVRSAGQVDPKLLRALDDAVDERSRMKRLLALITENEEQFGREAMDEKGVIDEIFGVRSRQDLKGFWETMKNDARVEMANLPLKVGHKNFGNWMEFMQHIKDGNLHTIQRVAKDMGMSMRLSVRGYMEKLDSIQRVFDRLNPVEKEVLDAVFMIARDEGIVAPLESLRKTFPDYFKRALPRNADEAVESLYNELEDFRTQFLADLETLGAIDSETYKFLAKPYGARLFDNYEATSLFRDESGLLRNLHEESVPGTGVTLGELESQRHIRKFKAQLYPGTATGATTGAPVTQIFDTFEAANIWLRDNYGLKDVVVKFDDDLGSLTGKTATGDTAVILQPLGEEVAKELGEIAPGAGMFIRLRGLVENSLSKEYFTQLARRGSAMTVAEWRLLPPREAARFAQVPNSPAFGGMAGKRVRKEILDVMDEFTQGKALRSALMGAVEQSTLETHALMQMLRGAGKVLTTAADVTVSALTFTKIALSPAVILTNFVGDNMMFATMATDLRINTSARGWRAGFRAARDMFLFRGGRQLPSQFSPRLKLAMDLGVIDEQLFGKSSVNQRNLQAVFGKLGNGRGSRGLRLNNEIRAGADSGVLDLRLGASAQRASEVIDGARGAFEAFIAPLRDPRRAKLVRRDALIDDILADPDISPEKLMRFRQEKYLLQQTLQSDLGGLAKAWAGAGNLMRLPLGKNLRNIGGGLADTERWSKNFYGDLGNTTRMRAFYYLLDQGFDPEVAARRIDTFMQTYSKVPAGIQRASKSLVGSPVLSFPYELGRISWNVARQRPALFTGMMLAGMGRNFAAMAGAGQNPYTMLAEMKREGGSDLMIPFMFMSRQYIPTGDGTTVSIQMPGLAAYENAFDLYGSVGGATKVWDDPSAEGLDQAVGAGANMVSKFLLGNPVTNAAASLIMRRDPRTGDVQRDTGALLTSNAVHGLSFFTPDWFPYVGANTSRLQEVADAPRQAYSKRRVSVFQAVAKRFFGIKIRGDISTLMPEGLETVTRRFTKAMAFIQGVELPNDPGIVFGEARGLDVLDLLATVRALTAPIDPGGGQDLAQEVDEEFKDVRRALDWINSDDAEMKREGALLLEDAEKRFLEKSRSQSKLNEPGLVRNATPRDFLNTIKSAQRLLDENQILANMSLQRRTAILATMARYGTQTLPGGEALMKRLTQQYFMSSPYSMRAPSVPQEIDASLRLIDESIRAATPWMDKQRLLLIQGQLKFWKAGAQIKEMRRTLTDSNNIKARRAKEDAERILREER